MLTRKTHSHFIMACMMLLLALSMMFQSSTASAAITAPVVTTSSSQLAPPPGFKLDGTRNGPNGTSISMYTSKSVPVTPTAAMLKGYTPDQRGDAVQKTTYYCWSNQTYYQLNDASFIVHIRLWRWWVHANWCNTQTGRIISLSWPQLTATETETGFVEGWTWLSDSWNQSVQTPYQWIAYASGDWAECLASKGCINTVRPSLHVILTRHGGFNVQW
jgi:hypothetical protein